MRPEILYIFGGEKAQGAEIVLERLMSYNCEYANAHLFIAPGNFASDLIATKKPYKITIVNNLKKLNRSQNGKLNYILAAVNNYLTVSYKVYKYIKANNINVIHANTIVPASYLIPLIFYSRLFLRSKKWVWSDHDICYFSRLDHYLSNLCVKLYNHTLVVSNAVKQKYASNKKVTVLYNGLDENIFKPSNIEGTLFRRQLNLPDNAVVLGMPAVVHPRKGQLQLIEAFNILSSELPNLWLLFAGGYEDSTPEYSASVKAAIMNNNRIKHAGYVKNMTNFYNACDLIVNNSDINGSEPLGTTIYEAMACQKIVIASATGGTPEIITDKIDGFLFKPENTVDLTSKLAYVIENINELNDLKIAARNKARSRFNINGMMESYNNIIIS